MCVLIHGCTYPHLSISYGCSVLCKSQHIQVHVVFSTPSKAETKAFIVPLQIYRVELSILKHKQIQAKVSDNSVIAFFFLSRLPFQQRK